MSIEDKKKWFREDIEGLRAIAVLSVIFYHAGLGFSGGFVGVDAFFVISGYLILRIILNKLHEGRFSLKDFYTRRIRRILPLSFTVVLATVFLGFFILEDGEFNTLAKSAVAAVSMVSNFFFAYIAKTDYFVTEAELQPLMHTWSLAIEEQFYLLIPFLLLCAHKLVPRKLLVVLIFIVVCSLYLCFTELQALAFFTPWSRAWEFSIAGCVAYLELSRRINLGKNISQALSLLGSFFLGFSIFYLDHADPYPSVFTFLPVFGTLMIITAHINYQGWLYKVLATRPMQWLGKLSYSLYLWHWPILVFRNHLMPEHRGWASTSVCLGLTLAISVFTYYKIENPFRYSRALRSSKKAFSFALFMIVSISLLSLGVVPLQKSIFLKMKQELPPRPVPVKPELKSLVTVPLQSVVDKAFDERWNSDFIVLGDSHCFAHSKTIDRRAEQYGLQGIQVSQNVFVPIPGLWNPKCKMIKGNNSFALACTILDDIKSQILSRKIRHVILINRWRIRTSLTATEEMRLRGVEEDSGLVSDSSEQNMNEELAKELMETHLGSFIEELNGAGTQVWILHQVPTVLGDPYHTSLAYLRLQKVLSVPQQKRWLKDALAEQKESRAFMDSFSRYQVKMIDPYPYLFGEQSFFEVFSREGYSYYYDDDHMNVLGSELYLSSMWDQVMSEIAQDKASSRSEALQ